MDQATYVRLTVHRTTLWCKCGPRPGSVARVLGVQSRTIRHATTLSIPDRLEPTRPVETPKNYFSIFRIFMRVCPTPNHLQRHHPQTGSESRAVAVAAVILQPLCIRHQQQQQQQQEQLQALRPTLFAFFSLLMYHKH